MTYLHSVINSDTHEEVCMKMVACMIINNTHALSQN